MPEQTLVSPQKNNGNGHPSTLARTRETTSSLVHAFIALTRADAALALTMPALGGAIMAWWEMGALNAATLIFTLLGVFAGNLAINLLWEYFDYRRSLVMDHHPGVTDLPPHSNYVLMRGGRIDPALARNLGLLFVLIGLACSLLVTLLTSWPVLFFSGLSFTLALLYAAPPIRYGYRGWGLGELGVFFAFGLLPALGAYYAQAESLTMTPVWGSLSMGLLAVLVVFNYNLLHYRRDWLIRKRMIPVMVGLKRGVDISAFLVTLAYGAVLLAVSLTYLPLWSLLTLGGLPVALGGYSRIWRNDRKEINCLQLYKTTVTATIVTGVLFSLALWLDKAL